MTVEELPAQVASIIQAAASPATCTPDTVELLKCLFFVTDNGPPDKQHAAPNHQRKALVQSSRAKKTTCSRSRKAPQVTILEEPQIVECTLSSKEKSTLAALVVNNALQSLTAALRDPTLAEPTKAKSSAARATSDQGSGVNPASLQNRPLKSRCLNRPSTSPSKIKPTRKFAVGSKSHVSGLLALAECACASFSALRKLRPKNNPKPDTSELQVENGVSALIGKLIALGFHDLAMRELVLLKKSLDGAEPAAIDSVRHTAEEWHVEALPDLFRCSGKAATGLHLPISVAIQFHALRIIAARPSYLNVKIALLSIESESPLSLVNMILRQQHAVIPGAQAKAAQQLESLANLLLGLCPRESKTDDDRLSKSERTISPQTTFQLQTLAFKIRATWWKVAQHKGDVNKEIWEPFSRCLTTFCRSPFPTEPGKYQTCKIAVEKLLEHVKAYGNQVKTPPSFQGRSLVEINQKMAEIARDCSEVEMDRWWRDARALLTKSSAPKSRLLSMECRRAALDLRAPTSSWEKQKILQQLTLVAEKLNVDVAGDIEDIEDFFVSINSIRKSISLVLGESQPEDSILQSRTWDLIQDHCESILVRGIWYIGQCIKVINIQNQKALRYEKIAKVVHDVTIPYIGSLVTLAKHHYSERDRWYRFDKGLEDSIGVIENLQHMSTISKPTITAARIEASLVSVSNVYWCRFLHLKKEGAERKALSRALGLSISPVDNESRPQAFAGFLPARLEQQGMFHERNRDFKEAAQSYLRALRTLIAAGSLSAIAEAAVFQPPNQLLSENGEWRMFGRLLIAYSRTALCIEVGHEMTIELAFGDEDFSTAEQGLLLEQQIRAFDTITAIESVEPKICEAFQTIVSAILTIYTQQAYPIRRLRVINQLLRMHSANPLIFSPEVCDSLAAPVDLTSESISLSSDSGLQQYTTHLMASQKIYNTLYNVAADLTVIRNSLAAWSTLLQDVSDNDSLRRCIDDIPNFRLQLECLTEYLQGQDLVLERLSTLKLLEMLHEALKPLPAACIVVKMMELGVQYSRLGNTAEAGSVLLKAQKYLNDIADDSSNMLASRWHLSYAEYSLSVGNVETSEQHLRQAGENLKQSDFDWESSRPRSDGDHEIALLKADFADVCSMSADAKGQPLKALYFGRRAVNTLYRAWSLSHGSKDELEKSPASSTRDAKETDPIALMSSLTISTLAPTPNPRTTRKMPMRRRDWLMIPRLFHSLSRLSTLYAHGGLSREAYYYMEQAQKVVEDMPCASYQARFHAQAGQLTNRSGDRESSTDHFDKAELAYQANGLDHREVEFQLFAAEKYMLERDFGAAEAALARANNTLDHITDIVTILGRPTTTGRSALEALMDRMSLTGVSRTTTRPDQRATRETSTNVTIKQPLKRPTKALPKASPFMRSQQARISRQRALTSLYAGDFDRTQELLSTSASDTMKPNQLVLQTLLEAQLCLHRGLESMAADLTFCVLPESTISCPSLNSLVRPPIEASSQIVRKNDQSGRTGRVASKKPARATKAPCRPPCPDFIGFLQQAQDSLSEVCTLAIKSISTAEMHTLVDVLSRTLMMSSSLGPSMLKSHSHPVTLTFVTEIGRTLASIKERKIIQIEQQTSSALKQLDWLTDASCQCLFDALDVPLDISKFHTECIDIIPGSWTLLSLSLSESRNELRLSRLRSGQTPFVISIPLNRSSSRDPDEDIFGFDQGKAEMLDIVNLANYSTHDTPDRSRKGAKTEWWEARAALDVRLRDLLVDIEGIWFGGFRGIFSNDAHDSNLALRFRESLHIILDRHLPSRQKATKSSLPDRVTLDIQVTGMFVALGNPNLANLDEEMTDLLYFVIDILQFHGESNAYDEIDFDTITVEVLDALRQYHAAAEQKPRFTSPQHTILVLDKALHCFPWESLPCLKTHAVSRVPSLAFLRDRILQQQAQSSSTPSKFLVKPSSGTYVLNPSGDLTATQSRFEDSLAALPHWDGIVAREPSETELESALSENEIFLYFGHGSGGQYIRPRTVKRLDRCAVALLMGCSSGTMTQAGTYESYGTPMNYMHAGCPAVVATLWDVTDKDIDRFSEATLEKWGLFKQPQQLQQQQQQVLETSTSPVKRGSPVKRAGRKGAKQKVATSDTKAMSLDQAVAQSRDTCIMKYLNGAAPVVYGIPVFLSS